MENYLICNKYLKSKSFENVYKRLSQSFEKLGEKLTILTNDKAPFVLDKNGNNNPILFFDKDLYLGKILEKWGYRLINSTNTIETCDDKGKTFLSLVGKVDMPESVFPPFSFSNIGYSDYQFIDDVIKKLSFPIIVKECKGSFGAQVYKAENKDELLSIVKKMKGSQFIFQKFIKSSCGRDLRVYVVGGKVVAYAERTNKNDFRSNVELGGKMQIIEPENNYLTTALKAVSELNCDFAGVDILFGENGPLVCEVNSNALFNGLSDVTGINVADEIAKYYLFLKL